jgi:hypothetical protein
MRKAVASHADAAKWCRRTDRTIRAWLAEKAPVDIESVLCSRRLRREFLRYLTVCDRRVRNGNGSSSRNAERA